MGRKSKYRVEPQPLDLLVEDFARACHFHESSIRKLIELGMLRTKGKGDDMTISSSQLEVPSTTGWDALHGND